MTVKFTLVYVSQAVVSFYRLFQHVSIVQPKLHQSHCCSCTVFIVIAAAEHYVTSC